MFRGEIKNGKANGIGNMTFSSGLFCSGAFFDNKRHGQVTCNYPNGGTYTGKWEYDQKHGFGSMNYPDGTVYRGGWRNGKREGQGTMWFSPGSLNQHQVEQQSSQESQPRRFQFVAGKLVGESEQSYRQRLLATKAYARADSFDLLTEKGSVYSGSWKEGKRHGHGTMKYKNGDHYEGTWKENKRFVQMGKTPIPAA